MLIPLDNLIISFQKFQYMTSWYCSECDKTIIIKTLSKHINSTSQKHKKKNSVVVKDYELKNPAIIEIFSTIDKCAEKFHEKHFHSFTFKCIYVSK